ncbi:hypothetical protein PR202_gb21903 [Eleusine coracana subsp. coracana]|uniref:glutamate synthase (ferredoxin) n=1 Tax=Eleusine coracana subsp. coracana TaxID=191504 RepID=A0AAV5FEB2_ELECO|nr:hypothetical protein PR202_gb21903 [Eleusine coracana subsp. coracana]
MATVPRAAPRPAVAAAARPPLLRAAPPLLLAGRAAAARRLRARGPSSLAAARRNLAPPARAVLGGIARRERPAAPQKPVQEVTDLNDILSERGACGVGFVANLRNVPSFNIVRDALMALGCMEHRGGCGADNDSGDGSGLMSGIPWDLFDDWANKQGLAPFDRRNTGVGMVFLPKDEKSMAEAKAVTEKVFKDEGLEVLGWRAVPFNVSVVGRNAKETMPNIEQVFVKVTKEDNADDIERELYISRKLIERAAKSESWSDELYFCSLSSRTIVYKGMLRSEVLGQFYLDLQNELYKSPFAIYHRRYSTNTNPRWSLAQPMRLLGHNGEINTIQGNLNWMRSREATLQSPVWRGREPEIRPFGDPKASDSANLDSTAELLLRSGRSPAEALMILVPEAYKNHPTLSIKYPEAVDFYDYYKGQMEAWDGPALLLFSDGKTVGATLDRNGLRPARYWRTSDDFVYVASEVGVIPMDESKVVMKGRLGPGMMITADLETGQVLENTEVKKNVASAYPYGTWLQERTRYIKPVNFLSSTIMDNETVLRHQQAFGYSSEDVQLVIESMASQGKEPTFCMGDDIPLAVLSQKPHLLYDYFKQRFAQVTNPAIDPLREGLVMSLEVNIGKRGNILEVGPENADQVALSSPVLNEGELESLLKDPTLKPKVLSTYFDIRKGLDGSLDKTIKALCEEADAAVRSGSQLLVLSDRSEEPVRTNSTCHPILLAVGAIHQHLIQNGLRMSASIVADTAQCFSTHHFACLIGYGASLLVPTYVSADVGRAKLSSPNINKRHPEAVKSGLLKILSKMGISLLSSYCGAQIFEIYGLGQEVVDLAFCGSVSKIGGLTLDELGRETLSFWVKAFSEDTAKRLENFGFIQSRPGGEYHANNPEMSKLLHKAIREKRDNAYMSTNNTLQVVLSMLVILQVLRDLLELKSDRAPIPIGKVEPATSIVERFCTGGMSLGAISRETHEAIAIAMNRIGGKSNSGEGGEVGPLYEHICSVISKISSGNMYTELLMDFIWQDPIRWNPLTDVVDGYSPTLPHLKGLQNGDTATSAIKQVASGRFGVTPTFLVNAEQIEIKIAQGAKPGEGGQLPGKKVSAYIARLRNSKPGVPLISPPPHHDIYSIEDLAQLIYDLHQINPKAKVSVKLVAEAGIGTVASGVSKGNADIIQISGHDGGTGASPISSIKHAGGPWELGLTETNQTLIQNGLRERVVLRVDGGFRSGQDVLIAAAMGADEYGFGSREELRARFPGVPGDLVNYFLFVAEEVRAALAQLGFEKLDDIIGRTDLLKPKHVSLVKTQHINLGYLLENAGLPKLSSSQIRSQDVHTNGPVLDETILADPEIADAIENEKEVSKTFQIYNVDRAVCGRVAGVIAKKYGDRGFAGQLNITFTGSAGQSFGCFLTPGMNVLLVGEANDYVGKGMAGGELVVVPVENTGFVPEDATIVGNTCLVGRNVAAGMTGGLAYILDEDDTLTPKVNKEIVKMQRVNAPAGQMQLKSLIEAYVEKTGSEKGATILREWEAYLPLFWQLVPPSEEDSPEACAEFERVLAKQATTQLSAK